MKMDIADIKVPKRHRQNLGDIASLAKSIDTVGLLHPPVVLPDGRLVAGERRIAALKQLGWTSCPVTEAKNLDEAVMLLLAERDENTERLQFSPSEQVSLADDLEHGERQAAKEREKEGGKEGGKKGGRGRPADRGGGSSTTPKRRGPKAKDRVAAAVGTSARSLKKAKEIVLAAKEDPERFGPLVEEMNKSHKVDRAYKKLKAARKMDELKNAQLAIAKETKKDIASVCDLRVCSCLELFNSGIKPDVVITYPPYEKKFLPLFSELAKSCLNVPLVAVMSGQSYLPEVINRLCEHLTYQWTLAYLTPGGQAVQQWEVQVNTTWKPVLLFGKASKWFGDVATSKNNDKTFHKWGQNEKGMMDLIERLSEPGQLICDPFCGGGTTALAAIALGRKFIGCDIDKNAIETTRMRIETMK